jgi:hypothetical protein
MIALNNLKSVTINLAIPFTVHFSIFAFLEMHGKLLRFVGIVSKVQYFFSIFQMKEDGSATSDAVVIYEEKPALSLPSQPVQKPISKQ